MNDLELKGLIAERIRQARDTKGISQSILATKTDMWRESVAEIELGRRNVSAVEVLKIAKALKVTVGHLLGVEDRTDSMLILITQDIGEEKLTQVIELLRQLRAVAFAPQRDNKEPRDQ